jgi:hypothetical protein
LRNLVSACNFSYFVSESQITQPPTITVCQVVIKINACPSVRGELDNGHYDNRLPVEEKEKSGISDEVWFFI